MMYVYEKDMKKAILDDMDNFKKSIRKIFDIEEKFEVKYVGEEIDVNTGKCDLLFTVSEEYEEDKFVSFYIVELKNRIGKCEDIGQISRYINGMKNTFIKDTLYNVDVYGLLVCYDLEESLINLMIAMEYEYIKVCSLSHTIKYDEQNYNYTDKAIEKAQKNKFLIDVVNKELG